VLAYHHILRVRQPGRRRPRTESGGDQGAAAGERGLGEHRFQMILDGDRMQRVWASPQAAPALGGAPRTRIVEAVESVAI